MNVCAKPEPGIVTIGNADDYAAKLRACHVIVDPDWYETLQEATEDAADAGVLEVLWNGLQEDERRHESTPILTSRSTTAGLASKTRWLVPAPADGTIGVPVQRQRSPAPRQVRRDDQGAEA